MELDRKELFGFGAAGLIGAAAGFGAAKLSETIDASAPKNLKYKFFGAHQSGITTPAQDRMHFAAFEMNVDATRTDLISLMRDWSAAAERMMDGLSLDTESELDPNSPPQDSGETIGLNTTGLTITFGFGRSLFLKDEQDRFGLADRLPSEFIELPHFPGDALKPEMSGGDLCIQACANDPQVAVHAIRNLTRIAFGRAVLKWSQLGYGRTSSTSNSQQTERNLMGFKDGTANLKAEDTQEIDQHVWISATSSQAWAIGGSYLVARRIRMNLESWDRSILSEQELVFGRNRVEGAPLSGGTEFTKPDFGKTNSDGTPAIDKSSHVFLAHPSQNGETAMLRRGYNFVDGNDELGRLNAGLFFISFQNDPESFIRVQRNLANNDRLNEYIQHVGSGMFIIPRGANAGSFVGAELLLA
ncbi:MAG: hypothetical protein RLZ53_387 [Actinomycetota bacterium]